MERTANVLGHLRANLLLVILTVLLCVILYPLVLLGIGQIVFPFRANGSLIGPDGKSASGPEDAVGSRQIAQEFKGGEWFQPRPSAASYNAAAAAGSNWGANNPKLRDRVARQLGPIVKYARGAKAGQPAGPDIERWFVEHPDRAVVWAKDYPTLAGVWVASDDLYKNFVSGWAKDHREVLTDWQQANRGKVHDPKKPEELAIPFFISYAKTHPGTWPTIVEGKGPDGKPEKSVQPVKEGTDIQSIFFDSWLQAHPQAELEKVPADMVTASGGGLDPHITLRNARYQMDRVATAQSSKSKTDPSRIRETVETILKGHAFTPLSGMVGGEPIVNVLEVNLALRSAMKELVTR